VSWSAVAIAGATISVLGSASATITLASLVTLAIPIVATIGAAVALGEPVTVIQVGGMALVITALSMILVRPPLGSVPPPQGLPAT
jgi:drug/metabolite transporter (DMT)-like permease